MKKKFWQRRSALVLTIAIIMVAVGIRGCAGASSAEASNESSADPAVHVHSYTADVIAATCVDEGYTLYVCECGDSHRGDVVPAVGHSYVDEVWDPTCTESGFTEHVCSVCDHVLIDSETEVLGHEWSDWETIQEPTTTDTGMRSRACDVCGEIEYDVIAVIPNTEHVHTYTAKAAEATCEAGGYVLHSCSCGDSYKDNYTSARGHSWSGWTVIVEATTTSAGKQVRTCTVCRKAEAETIPVVSVTHTHSYTSVWYQPTCTENGYMLHVCSTCGDTYNSDGVSALGHSWSEWEVTVEATTYSAGEKQCTCSRCGDVKKEVVPKLDPGTGDVYESYIDPRIEVKEYRASVSYAYCDIRVSDTRTWGDSPSIWVNEDGSLRVIYHNTTGEKVNVTVTIPPVGYIRNCVIMEEGTYILTLIGDPG